RRELDRGQVQPHGLHPLLKDRGRDLVEAADQETGHGMDDGHAAKIPGGEDLTSILIVSILLKVPTRQEVRLMTRLGTLEELPQEYRDAMARAGVAPLWPMMRNVLPHGKPSPLTRPGFWRYADVRPLLLRAGELTP